MLRFRIICEDRLWEKNPYFFINLKNTNIMKKQKVSKRVVGIDISKDSFYACYKIKNEN